MGRKYIYRIFYLALGILLTSCGLEVEKVEEISINKGYQGEAKRNPYLAVEKLLTNLGIESSHGSQNIFDIYSYGTVVLPASSVQRANQVAAIQEFIEEGGHFICVLENGEAGYSDFQYFFMDRFRPFSSELIRMMESYSIQLVSPLNIEVEMGEVVEKSDDPVEVKSTESNDFEEIMREKAQRSYEVPDADQVVVNLFQNKLSARIGGESYAKDTGDLVTQVERKEGDAYLNTYKDNRVTSHKIITKAVNSYNYGRITVIADGRFLRNPHIGTQDHAALFVGLMELSNYEGVYFSSGRQKGFIELVIERYPLGLACLLIIVFLWIINRVQRFGPILNVVTGKMNGYLQSIEMSSQFIWKRGDKIQLLEPLRRRACIASGMKAWEEGVFEEHLSTVAEELQLEKEKIRSALYSLTIKNPTELLDSVTLLQKIIRHYE